MQMRAEKHCPGCKKTLPRNAFNHKGKSKANGKPYLTTLCKKCQSADRANNRERENESMRKWRSTHRIEYNGMMQRYRLRNPGVVQARKESERLKSPKLEIDYINSLQWQQTLKHFNNACAYCGSTKHLEMDHFVPLTLEGRATVDNLIPACRKCNRSKGNNHPAMFLPIEVYERVLSYLATRKHVEQLPLINGETPAVGNALEAGASRAPATTERGSIPNGMMQQSGLPL